jgi:hypothetical protein
MRTLSIVIIATSVASLLSSVSKVALAEEEVAGVPEHRIHPGPEVDAGVGMGFSDQHSLNFGGRVGYTTSPGIYMGADLQHYIGRVSAGSPHLTLVGGDVGLKLFPTQNLEIRPYGFAGVAIPGSGSAKLALDPGILAAYHFGRAFVDVDARYLATPGPTGPIVTGGGGVSF